MRINENRIAVLLIVLMSLIVYVLLVFRGGQIFEASYVGMWSKVGTPDTNPLHYNDCLKAWDTKLIAHFPQHIPANATKTSFYFLPGFLQGGSIVELSCVLPESDVDAVIKKYARVAEQTESKLAAYAHKPEISLVHLDEKTDVDPQAFQMYVLDAEPYMPSSWNHGYFYGVAVSTQDNRVIYFAQVW
jgi:hypothetical protein